MQKRSENLFATNLQCKRDENTIFKEICNAKSAKKRNIKSICNANCQKRARLKEFALWKRELLTKMPFVKSGKASFRSGEENLISFNGAKGWVLAFPFLCIARFCFGQCLHRLSSIGSKDLGKIFDYCLFWL